MPASQYKTPWVAFASRPGACGSPGGGDTPIFPLRAAPDRAKRQVRRLPVKQAALIALVISGETSPAALAGRTGCGVNTVISRWARARAQLRREMEMAFGAQERMRRG